MWGENLVIIKLIFRIRAVQDIQMSAKGTIVLSLDGSIHVLGDISPKTEVSSGTELRKVLFLIRGIFLKVVKMMCVFKSKIIKFITDTIIF